MGTKKYATPTNEDLGQTSNWSKLVAAYLSVARPTILDRLVKLQMYDKTSLKLHHFVFENQSIYIRCHKSFCINLGEGTLFFTQIIFILLFLVVKLSLVDGYLQR